ncbi:MAG: hypothetical protein AMJ46_10480 [Latescibacteria bacterium DG_63]|nr:MAG: hypothetical protein AMJ46_10480 [Latescibacteria bacterium DG_63]
MAKLFYVGVVAALALGLVAPQGWASVPDVGYSTTWEGIPGSILFCPNGDGSTLEIEIKDQFNAPMGGVLVDVHLAIDCPDLACCVDLPTWLPDTTFTTDTAGKVPIVTFPCGRDQAADTACCTIQTQIVCLGVTLFSGTYNLTTPDLSQSEPLYVSGTDYSIFALDWLKDRCRSDYNADGIVEGLDYSIFALHWLHVCP